MLNQCAGALDLQRKGARADRPAGAMRLQQEVGLPTGEAHHIDIIAGDRIATVIAICRGFIQVVGVSRILMSYRVAGVEVLSRCSGR